MIAFKYFVRTKTTNMAAYYMKLYHRFQFEKAFDIEICINAIKELFECMFDWTKSSDIFIQEQ